MNVSGNIIDSYTLINVPTGIADKEKKSLDVRIFPNPSVGKFDFYCNQDLTGTDFEIYNIRGQLIKKVRNTSDIEKNTIDISGQSAGLYFLKTNIKGVPITSKLIIIQK